MDRISGDLGNGSFSHVYSSSRSGNNDAHLSSNDEALELMQSRPLKKELLEHLKL